MNFEFHYYVNFIVAITAGFTFKDACKIAYSAQYVDHNHTQYNVYLAKAGKNIKLFTNHVSCSNNIMNPSQLPLILYLAFHFVPGNPQIVAINRSDQVKNFLCTTKNANLAKKMLIKGLETKDPYYIGIASHAYADTWAHQNFSGVIDEINALYPPRSYLQIGHLDAFTLPDSINTVWYDTRLKNPLVDNNAIFIEAAIYLLKHYMKFRQHSKVNYIQSKRQLQQFLGSTFQIPNIKYRIQEYRKYIELTYSKKLQYFDEMKWIKKISNHEIIDDTIFVQDISQFQNSDWYKFQIACKAYFECIYPKLLARIHSYYRNYPVSTELSPTSFHYLTT
ncbi:Putative conserved hypothetical protein [Candidatus Fokinia solitaria]|uniref:Uncharacterized protein n=1 Tax=Candidatus Fokinia solitaria TaxID=1802984 RepID=A0A2U8BRI7_9RICK|nr:DUF6765 family protein [Candidatus Fokinia solitaria]AWD32952.1 Putative conserved hypothetical protein [Candidatus Fokinia solitaria]